MFKNIFTSCNIYISLFMVYHMQGTFYPFGSIIAKVVLLIALILSVYYWIYANLHYKLNSVMKIINLLIIMFSIYGIFYYLFGTIAVKSYSGISLSAFDYLKNIYISLMSIFPLYVFAKKNQLNEKVISCWIPIFLIVCTSSFFVYETQRMLHSEYDTDGLTNNIAYHFLSLFPLLFFYRDKKVLQWIMLGYIMIFIIYGMKRGAILIGCILLVVHIYKTFKNSSSTQKIVVFLLCLVFSFILIRFVKVYMSDISYFQYRIEQTVEGDSSGRGDYYKLFVDYFMNISNPIKVLFGGGAYETVRINGNTAHNDWIELLINNGLLGFVLYLIYMKRLFSFTHKNQNSIYYDILLPFFIIYFLKTFISMSYTTYTIYTTVAIAYAFAKIDSKTIKK